MTPRHRSPPRRPLKTRRQVLQLLSALGSGLALSACGSGGGADPTPAPMAAPIRAAMGVANTLTITIDPQASGRPVNRQVLGHNVQWVDRGDELVNDQGVLRPAMLTPTLALGPTVLRYPGGLQSDTYRWAKGIGTIAERGSNEHANSRAVQTTVMGTREFLELCEATGATPLITVNLVTGTPDEAAAWVKQVNIDRLRSSRTGQLLPRVPLWELGNEPYLKPDERPDLWLSPAEFSRRARLFLAAMRAVDPSIQLSLPLTNDLRNGFQATPYQGFTREVLATPINGLNAISLHNAYTPFGMDKAYTDDQLYWGAMAGSRTVATDFQRMRELLATLLPGQTLPFVVTEFNALFTLGRGDSDRLPLSPAGALAVADVLRELASTPDLTLATFWSLSGNGFFGAIDQNGRGRPTYEVLRLFGEALRGQLIGAQVQAPTVSTPSVGGSAAVAALPVAEALVTREGNTLRLLLIHKDPANPAQLRLNLGNTAIASLQMSLLRSDQLFDRSDQPGVMQRVDTSPAPDATLSVPAHSIALITVTLSTPPSP